MSTLNGDMDEGRDKYLGVYKNRDGTNIYILILIAIPNKKIGYYPYLYPINTRIFFQNKKMFE